MNSLLRKDCVLIEALRPDGVIKTHTVAFVSF